MVSYERKKGKSRDDRVRPPLLADKRSQIVSSADIRRASEI
jgi:hypothetical protein